MAVAAVASLQEFVRLGPFADKPTQIKYGTRHYRNYGSTCHCTTHTLSRPLQRLRARRRANWQHA